MASVNFSRRSFFVGGAAALASIFLPRAEGAEDGFSLVPLGVETAYAADGASVETEVMVVSRTEVGVAVYDFSDAQAPVAVPDATVRIYSRATGCAAQGTTDGRGLVVLDLAELGEDPDAEIPACNGSVTVTKDGFRDVHIPLMRVIAHQSMVAPTRPLDGKPYFRMLSMNEWDAQYIAADYVCSESSDVDQVVEADLWLPNELADSVPAASLVRVRGNEEQVIDEFEVALDGNIAHLRAAGPYLLLGGEKCVEVGDRLKVSFSAPGSDASWYTFLTVKTKPAALGKWIHTETEEVVIPSAIAGGGVSPITLPDSFVTPFGGASFTCWMPTLPILYDFSPLGYAMLGFDFGSTRTLKDDGSFNDGDDWVKTPSQGIDEQCAVEKARQEAALDRYIENFGTPDDPNKAKHDSYYLTDKFKIITTLQAFEALQYNWTKEEWAGQLSFVVGGKLDMAWTWQTCFMGAPLYFVVNPWARAQVGGTMGATMKSILDHDFSSQKNTLGLNMSVGIAVTAGLGVAGAGGVSATGSGYLSFYIEFCNNRGEEPVRLIGAGAAVLLTIQLGFFKAVFPFYKGDWPDLYDSRRDKHLACASEPELDEVSLRRLGSFAGSSGGTGELPTFEELARLMKPVTNDQLRKSREFERTLVASGASPVRVSGARKDDYDGDAAFGDVRVALLSDADAGDAGYLPAYSYCGTMTRGALAGRVGISDVAAGERGGVVPSVNDVLLSNVNSNTAMRLVTTSYGRTVLFRVASVDVGGGKMRSRLVYQVLSGGEWGDPELVEFDPQLEGVSRDDLYDFEFDVAQATAGNGAGGANNFIFLLVTSGDRPDGDDTDFVRGIQAHHVSLVALRDTGTGTLDVYAPMTVGLPSTSDGYTITAPRITGYSDETSVVGTNDFCVMGFFTRRKVDTGGIGERGLTMGFFARREPQAGSTEKEFVVSRVRAYPEGYETSHDIALLPVAIADDGYRPGYDSVASRRHALYAFVDDVTGDSVIGKLEARYDHDEHGTATFASFDRVELASLGDDYPRVHRFYPWGEDGEYLASCAATDADGNEAEGLFLVKVDPVNGGEPVFTRLSPQESSVTNFVVDSGHRYLFYTENIDGKVGQGYSESAERGEDAVEHRHYIMAIAYVDGLFTKPFIFCELGEDQVIDDLVATTVCDNCANFMVSSITDIDNSLADIYDVRVPLTRCLTPTHMTLTDYFAFSGEEATFSVEARNDGNLVATGATFSLCDADTGRVVDYRDVAFGGIETTSSAGMPDAGCTYETKGLEGDRLESRLVADDGSGVLLPGDANLYRVTFAIPEEWEGKKDVYVTISNVQVINPTVDLLADLSGAIQEFRVDDSRCPVSSLELDGVKAVCEGMGTGEVCEARS